MWYRRANITFPDQVFEEGFAGSPARLLRWYSGVEILVENGGIVAYVPYRQTRCGSTPPFFSGSGIHTLRATISSAYNGQTQLGGSGQMFPRPRTHEVKY